MVLSLRSSLLPLRCLCSVSARVVSALVGRRLPVARLAVCCLWLLALVACWWLSLLFPFALLVFVRRARFSALALALGVRSRLPLVVVVACCCGFPLASSLLSGLACPGLLVLLPGLVLSVAVAVVGGLVLLFPFPRSCRFFSGFVGASLCSFVGRGINPHHSLLALG
jgi:hypothetical protein